MKPWFIFSKTSMIDSDGQSSFFGNCRIRQKKNFVQELYMKKLSLIAGLTAMIMSSGSMSLELGDMLYESVKQSVKINTSDHEPTVLDISKEFNHRYPTNLFTLIINNAEKAKASSGEGDGVFYDAKNNSLIGQDPRNDESPTLKATLFKSCADHYLFMLTATMELGGLYSDESHYFGKRSIMTS